MFEWNAHLKLWISLEEKRNCNSQWNMFMWLLCFQFMTTIHEYAVCITHRVYRLTSIDLVCTVNINCRHCEYQLNMNRIVLRKQFHILITHLRSLQKSTRKSTHWKKYREMIGVFDCIQSMIDIETVAVAIFKWSYKNEQEVKDQCNMWRSLNRI